MTEHISVERMNESRDGLLTASEVTALERHIETCVGCRNEYARLSETIRAIAKLPSEASAPEGTWALIATRIGDGACDESSDEVSVYRLPTSARATRRLSLSLPQAAAAGIAVALFSAGLMWVAIEGGGPDRRQTASAARAAPGGAAARAVSLEGMRYTEVVGQLEQILEEGRSMLTPETLVSIEESLATIDDAIDEIESALAADPNSDLLLRMLANHRGIRLGVLQRAAAAVQAQV